MKTISLEEKGNGIGIELIEMLNLKFKDGKVRTAWGTKTPLGLYLSIKNIIEALETN